MTSSGPLDRRATGERVGPYELGALIGAGSFGAVYRARDTTTGRAVAVKLLHGAGRLDEATVARFKREARLVMALTHPSTVRALGAGDTSDGSPFIVFELLTGESLDRVLRRGPLPIPRVVEIAEAILGSLAEAHGRGIVHRDIKPANVFLCAEGTKVLDFGVAKVLVQASLQTPEGLVLGTPGYMAPEQMAAVDVGPTADVYAVALVIAEMISGAPVYTGNAISVCAAKLDGVPPVFDESVRHSGLGPVLERATAFDPARRYPTAGEMADAIRATLAMGLAKTAAHPRVVVRSGPPANPSAKTISSEYPGPRRGPRVALVVAGAAAAAAVGVTLAIVPFRQTKDVKTTTTAPAEPTATASTRQRAVVVEATEATPPPSGPRIPLPINREPSEPILACTNADVFTLATLGPRVDKLEPSWGTHLDADLSSVGWPDVKVIFRFIYPTPDEKLDELATSAQALGYVVFRGNKQLLLLDAPMSRRANVRAYICR